jgi:hypothetical protein
MRHAVIRLEPGLAAKLSHVPEGGRTEYIRKALELMVDISPPGAFKVPEAAGNDGVSDVS